MKTFDSIDLLRVILRLDHFLRPRHLTSALVPNPRTYRPIAVPSTTLIGTMDYSTLAGALASAVTAFEATLDEVEVVKPPETSLTVQPTIQSPRTEPSLTIESIFTLPTPESVNHQSTLTTGKREKRRISFCNKKSSRFLWRATPQLRARVWHELEMARRAARLAKNRIVPFQDIPYGPTTGALDGGTVNKSVSPFPGNVYIQDPVAAVLFALSEYETCRGVNAAKRLTFWVDASVWDGLEKGTVGIAVVHKDSRDPKDWITQGYTIPEILPVDCAECLAIAQALHNALDLMDRTPTPGSAVVVFSDSRSALTSILNFDLGSREFGHAIIETILIKARELSRRGVRVFLHWVPSHQHVPGNELADWVARLARFKRQ